MVATEAKTLVGHFGLCGVPYLSDPSPCLWLPSPRPNRWIVEATSCRFSEVWHGGAAGKVLPDSALPLMRAAAVFWCIFPVFVWRSEGVKCYVMISMIAVILLFTQDILLDPLLLFSERWGSRVHCGSLDFHYGDANCKLFPTLYSCHHVLHST